MADWTRNDYVRLTIQHDESFMYHVYVVASDWPNMYDHHDDECWIVAVHDNDIVGDGLTGIGIACASATDRVRTNTISGFATGINVCSDDGGNIVSP